MKPEDIKRLTKPFPPEDIDWRLQSCGKAKNGKIWGKVLAYITSRAVQDRLDEVCGPDGWQTAIRKEGDAYLCTLSIRVTHEDGTTEWISRTDGAESTDIEAVKGGISGAIKRAAVHFGIGRYLYNLQENWAIIDGNGKFAGKTKDGDWFNWNPPPLPAWAIPQPEPKPLSQSDQELFIRLKREADDMIEKNLLSNNMAAQLEHLIATREVRKLENCVRYARENIARQEQVTSPNG